MMPLSEPTVAKWVAFKSNIKSNMVMTLAFSPTAWASEIYFVHILDHVGQTII